MRCKDVTPQPHVQDGLVPEPSGAIDAILKEVDRQWKAEELIFYFINLSFRMFQFDNVCL